MAGSCWDHRGPGIQGWAEGLSFRQDASSMVFLGDVVMAGAPAPMEAGQDMWGPDLGFPEESHQLLSQPSSVRASLSLGLHVHGAKVSPVLPARAQTGQGKWPGPWGVSPVFRQAASCLPLARASSQPEPVPESFSTRPTVPARTTGCLAGPPPRVPELVGVPQHPRAYPGTEPLAATYHLM